MKVKHTELGVSCKFTNGAYSRTENCLFPIATIRFVSPFISTICPSADGHLIDKSHVEYRVSDNQESKTAQKYFVFHQKGKKLVSSWAPLQIPQLSVTAPVDTSPC